MVFPERFSISVVMRSEDEKYSRGMASFVVMMMLSPVAAQAADGKVTFNGEVIENTCTVVNKDKTVTLPTVQRSALSSAGETAGVVPFTIDLTSCTPGADVSVYFEKDQYVSTEGRLKTLCLTARKQKTWMWSC